MMEQVRVWLLPAALTAAEVLAGLVRSFLAIAEPEHRTRATWFDTFDWRLYSHGLLLSHDRRSWHLLVRDSAAAAATLDAPGKGQWRFCHDFPPSRVRSLLEPVVAGRRLLPLFSHETSTIARRVLNRDDKSVALVFLETHHLAAGTPAVRTLRLQGMRGYDRDFGLICDFLAGYGIGEQIAPAAFFDLGVKGIGRAPLDYSSKFRPALHPEMTARQAMVIIYGDLLAVMQRNEPGMTQDLDAEFLHDFRVALRRTRAGLSQVKKVLPDTAATFFRREFGWLGEVTGPLRDLDVYLLAENGYRSRLPEELRPGLDPFFADLRGRKERELERLRSCLRARRYRHLMKAWREFLDNGGGSEEAENSALPVAQLARRVIGRRYRRLLRAGEAITPSSPAGDYHRLRIQGKKLRYLLEFFSALFPQAAMASAIKELKHLQDNLGAYNDLAVQQVMLREYLAGVKPGSRKSLALAAAIGGLLTGLRDEQTRVGQEFARCFAEFSRPANRSLFRRMGQQKK